MRLHTWCATALLSWTAAGCAATPTGSGASAWTLPVLAAREAEAAPTRLPSLTLTQALDLARRWHPSLSAAGARVVAGRGRAQQAGVWANPELELETEEGDSGRAAGFGADATLRATLAWEIPLWGAPGARRNAALADLRGREAAVEQQQRVIEAIVRATFARAVAADDALVLARQTAALAAQAAASAKTRREAGQTNEPDLIRTNIEHERALDALEAAEEERALAYAELAAAIGLPAVTIEGLQGSGAGTWPEIALGRVAQLAAKNAPAIRVGEAAVAAAQADVGVARRERWPTPQVRVSVATAKESGERDTFLEWGIGFPLPVFDRNAGAILETEAAVAEAAADLRATRNEVAGAAMRLAVRYARQRGRYLRHRDRLVPEAERSLTLIQRGFPAQFSQLELLDAQRTLAEARAGLIERRAELASVAAALEALTATSLDELAPAGTPAGGDKR